MLRERREHPELFTGYSPLLAEGPGAEHLVAFDRGGVIAVAARLALTLQRNGGWQASTLNLPAGDYTDRLTGQRHSGQVLVSDLLARFPVALLSIG